MLRVRPHFPALPVASPVRAGRLAGWLLLPHLVIGTYLLVVPDHVTFAANQIATLLHVLAALATIPIAALTIFGHARRMRAPASRSSWVASALKWMLAATTVAAFASGGVACFSGQGMPPATVHAVIGIAIAVPLALHLALAGRWLAASTAVGALAVGTLGSLAVRHWVPGVPEAPVDPGFAYKTRPTSLYDSAQWCAECHREIYDEWARSSHARTLGIERVHRELNAHQEVLEFDMQQVGDIVAGREHYTQNAHQGSANAVESCTNCHVPLSFYGDDPTPVMQARAPSNEAVTCTFCHTLRDVKETGSFKRIAGTDAGGLRGMNPATLLDQMPYYVSAPETVRRYMWQNDSNALLHWLGNLLVRWRPDMHRHDYHSKELRSSLTCAGCHGSGMDMPQMPVRSYPDWEASRYNTHDPRTTVNCQDCHMTTHPTGKPVQEPGRLVSWGPERPQRRSHLFLGGNVAQANQFGDQDLAVLQHALNQRAVAVRIVDTQVSGATLFVRVAVKNTMTGHLFTSYESALRFAWVQVEALGADGSRVAVTPPPGHDMHRAPAPTTSPVIFRCVDDDLRMTCDTAIPPDQERVFQAQLTLANPEQVARVRASVFHTMDPEPIAVADRPLGPAGPQVQTTANH